MNKSLSRCDVPIIITVFLALGGLGMMFIFSGLIGFGIHSLIGKISLYICFGLQMLNVIVILIRRQYLKSKYGAPDYSTKMRHFAVINFCIWLAGALLLIFSLVVNIFWLPMSEGLVSYPCTIGACIAPIGWLGLLASFHRTREAVLYKEKQATHGNCV